MWGGERRDASAIPRHRAPGVMWRGRRRAILRSPRPSMTASFAPEPGRLNGWKEIALHLGKGTRTVQRWEKLYGLPVHRIGREGGEIVFAFRDEIDRWMAATESAGSRVAAGTGRRVKRLPSREVSRGHRSRPTSRRPRATTPGPGGSRSGVVGLSWPRPPWPWSSSLPCGGALGLSPDAGTAKRPAPAREPASWRMANESLTVFDAAGRCSSSTNSASPSGRSQLRHVADRARGPRRC